MRLLYLLGYRGLTCVCWLGLTFLTAPVAVNDVDAGSTGYHVAKKFTYGIGEAAWDYWDMLTFDPATRRLYVTHSTKVDVIDADSGKLVGEVTNTPRVHGVALVPELGKGFASNGEADTVIAFDLGTLAHIAEIKVGKDPDDIIYDPGTRRVFVANGHSDSMTAIDPATEKVIGTFPLGGQPEGFVTDRKGTLWVNLQNKNAFVTVDAKALKVKWSTPTPGCDAPASMAIDLSNRRLFIGCGGRTLAVVDAYKGNVIATLPIGEHVDNTTFDPETRLIFSSTGDGNITIVHEDSPNKYRVVDTVKTMRAAKTMTFDPKTKKIFLPTVENVPPTVSGPPQRSGPNAYKPGPFVILVVEK